MSSTYNLVADFAMTAYIAPHVVLRFAFFYLLAIQIFSKPRQSTFAAITLAGLGHAFDTSILDWRVAFIVALDMAAVLGVLVCFLWRHYTLTRLRPDMKQPSAAKDISGEHYTLFVMGSGGHTAEMLSMIERSIRPLSTPLGKKDISSGLRQVRRYVISHGDHMSIRKVNAFEANMAARFAAIGADSGSYDIKLVARARRVHQSWLSTPASFAKSILSIIAALYASLPLPEGITATSSSKPRKGSLALYPGVIVTNGPATAFAVVLVSHVLRILRLVPQTQMHAIYIESFAKVSTLSLTGKLLYMLDLADQFIVQWPRLHDEYPRTQLCMYFSVRPAEPVVPELEPQ